LDFSVESRLGNAHIPTRDAIMVCGLQNVLKCSKTVVDRSQIDHKYCKSIYIMPDVAITGQFKGSMQLCLRPAGTSLELCRLYACLVQSAVHYMSVLPVRSLPLQSFLVYSDAGQHLFKWTCVSFNGPCRAQFKLQICAVCMGSSGHAICPFLQNMACN
jgi:hypothetical protein